MKVSKQQLGFFTKRCHHWVDFYGLHDYDLEVLQDDLDDGTFAECRFHYPGKNLYIVVRKDFPGPQPNSYERYLDKIAHHEVLEGLLSRFRHMCGDSQIDEADEAVHTVIHRMWNALKRAGLTYK